MEEFGILYAIGYKKSWLFKNIIAEIMALVLSGTPRERLPSRTLLLTKPVFARYIILTMWSVLWSAIPMERLFLTM